jgi:hypothetical protein
MKAYVLNEDENFWAGFLYDEDCQSEVVRRFLRPGANAESVSDPAVIAEARDKSRTIVTSNGYEFIRYVLAAQKKNLNTKCEDCWGLVILPNANFQREYALKKANVRNGIRLGGKVISWKAVGYANLCVRLNKDGRVQVSRFKRCQFCEQACPIEAAWYMQLPLL